jgi:type II secretory pathway component PulF
MQFYYSARTDDGQTRSGSLDAPTRLAALKSLADQGWHVDYVGPQPLRAGRERVEVPSAQRQRILPVLLVLRPWPGHMSNFYHQLGQLLSAGITAHEAAAALSQRAPSPVLRQVMGELAPELAAGGSFAEGLARYPQLFPPEDAGLLRAAERSGDWPGICSELEDWYSRIHKGLIWLILARTYYTFVIVLSVLIPFFPKIIDPAFGLHWYVHFMLTRLLPVLVSLFALWLGSRIFWSLPHNRPLRDRLILYVPVARTFEMRAAGLRFFRALGSLLHAGVDPGEGLTLAADATGNVVLAAAVRGAGEAVRHGARIEDISAGLPFLTFNQRSTLATAFQAGRLDEGLRHLADDAREQTAGKLQQNRFLTIGAIGLVVTILGVIAVVIGWLNVYSAMAARAGISDIWQELQGK